jgi:hypothetical protein
MPCTAQEKPGWYSVKAFTMENWFSMFVLVSYGTNLYHKITKKKKSICLTGGMLLLLNLYVLVDDIILDEVQVVGRCCSVILCV